MQVIYRSPSGTPFPVDWEDRDRSRSRWRWDQVHNPTPLTPLAQDLIAIKREGMYKGGETTGRPFNEERMYANGYGFARSLEIDPAVAETAQRVAEQDSRERIDHLVDLWESSYRPETESLTRFFLNWAAASDPLDDLLSRYDQVQAAWRRCGELHTISTGLASVAMRQFDEFCRELFGDEGTRIAVESISGMPNMSIESGKALWSLSRELIGYPPVISHLESHGPSAFMSQIDNIDGGPEFASQLSAFLEEWGQRNESYYEVGDLTWREDPSFVLAAALKFASSPDERSPATLHDEAVQTRISRTNDVQKRLAGTGKWDEFLVGQLRAQQHTVLMEDHNYYIDQRAYTSLRVPHQAIGARLVDAGALDHQDDVFFLHVKEIEAHDTTSNRRYQDLVQERKADQQAWMHVLPPPYIGDDAPIFSDGDAVVVAKPGQRVNGTPASAGSITGIARVILSLDEAHRLNPGEVLVTYATAPPWTPIFAVAGAVVTDAGGPLAHCAVVAREYGIPAVVGAGNATTSIPDGATVDVNGATGIVSVLDQ